MTDETKPAGPPICFMDTETTSTRPDREVWEVGIVLRRDGQRDHEQQWFLPVSLAEADRFALGVGRFYDRHPYGRYLSRAAPDCRDDFLPFAAERHDKWREIGRLLHGAVIVNAVPHFDTQGIVEPLRDADVLPAHDYHLVDVGTLAAGFLAGQGKPVPSLPWRSGDVAEWLGIEPTPEAERHTALGDAKLAMRIYDHVVAGASR